MKHYRPEHATIGNTLPDKPSELLKVGLEEFNKCRALGNYVVDMANWFTVDDKGTCYVCFAGAVMAQRLTMQQLPGFSYTNNSDNYKLYALDKFRVGYLRRALESLMVVIPESLPHEVEVPEYKKDPEGFVSAMENLVTMLEGVGL